MSKYFKINGYYKTNKSEKFITLVKDSPYVKEEDEDLIISSFSFTEERIKEIIKSGEDFISSMVFTDYSEITFDNQNKSHIKYCVAYTLFNRDKVQVDYFSNFENENDAKTFYKELLENENLYTANFCEVIETTE